MADDKQPKVLRVARQNVAGGGSAVSQPTADGAFKRAYKRARLRETSPEKLVALYQDDKAPVGDLYEYAKHVWGAKVDELSPSKLVQLFKEKTGQQQQRDKAIKGQMEGEVEVVMDAVEETEQPVATTEELVQQLNEQVEQEEEVSEKTVADAIETLSDEELEAMIGDLPEAAIEEVVDALAEVVQEQKEEGVEEVEQPLGEELEVEASKEPKEQEEKQGQYLDTGKGPPKTFKEWQPILEQELGVSLVQSSEGTVDDVVTKEEATNRFKRGITKPTTQQTIHQQPYSTQPPTYASKEQQLKQASMSKKGYVKQVGDEWCIYSHETHAKLQGKCYVTKQAAQERLQQMQMFKHMKDGSVVVGYLEDKEDPRWLVSVDEKPVLAISFKQAFPDTERPDYQDDAKHFRSEQYGEQLRQAVEQFGIDKVYEKHFGNGKMATLLVEEQEDKKDEVKQAQAEQYCVCAACNIQVPNKQDGSCAEIVCPKCGGKMSTAVTGEKKEGQLQVTQQPAPAPALATPEVQQEVAKEPKEFSGVIDVMVDVAAVMVSNIETLTVDMVIEELVGIFADEESKNQFAGRLKETVEQKGQEQPGALSVEQQTAPQPVAAPPAVPAVQMASKQQESQTGKATQEKQAQATQEKVSSKDKLRRHIASLQKKVADNEQEKQQLDDRLNSIIRAPRVKKLATKMAQLDLGEEKQLFKKWLTANEKDFLEKESEIEKLFNRLDETQKEARKQVTGSLLPIIPKQATEDKLSNKSSLFNWSAPPKL